MKSFVQLVIIAALVAVAYFAFKYFKAKHDESEPRVRVNAMLQAMQDDFRQTALSMWFEGKYLTDEDSFGSQEAAFERFWRETGMSKAPRRWEILEVERDEESGGSTVKVRVDDQTIRLWVEPGEPIELLD
jgi:hypothetical protein